MRHVTNILVNDVAIFFEYVHHCAQTVWNPNRRESRSPYIIFNPITRLSPLFSHTEKLQICKNHVTYASSSLYLPVLFVSLHLW